MRDLIVSVPDHCVSFYSPGSCVSKMYGMTVPLPRVFSQRKYTFTDAVSSKCSRFLASLCFYTIRAIYQARFS